MQPQNPPGIDLDCIVATLDELYALRFVLLLPITHAAPRGDNIGVEIPTAVCRQLGLDGEWSWVIVSEYHVDQWPNAGLRSSPGRPGVLRTVLCRRYCSRGSRPRFASPCQCEDAWCIALPKRHLLSCAFVKVQFPQANVRLTPGRRMC